MTTSSERPTPPEGLPAEVIDALADCSPEELRKAIVYAQELLHFNGEEELPINPEANDDILRVIEHEGHTEVVKQYRCADGCDDCPHGPYLYRVKEVPQPDGSDNVHWSLLGPVDSQEE